MAAFAPDVADAAREGDLVAARVWSRAARELAAAVTAAIGQVFPGEAQITVSWNGSLFRAGDLLHGPFARHVAEHWPRSRLVAPRGTALDGAAALAAAHPGPMFSSLIQVCGS